VYRVLSAQGEDLGSLPINFTEATAKWADDSTHFCAVRKTGETSAEILMLSLGAPARRVSTLTWPHGNGWPTLDVCSVKNDVAVVHVSMGEDAAGHIVEVKVIRLSTGATLRDVRPPAPDFSGRDPRPAPGALAWILGSADGRLLALAPYTEMDAQTALTPIVDTVSGRVLGRVNGGFVRAFSGDNAAVFTDTGKFDWRTGRQLPLEMGCCDSVAAVRIGGPEVVVYIATGPAAKNSAQPPVDLVLVRPGAPDVKLACCGARLLS
jgi:hypothetical protein